MQLNILLETFCTQLKRDEQVFEKLSNSSKALCSQMQQMIADYQRHDASESIALHELSAQQCQENIELRSKIFSLLNSYLQNVNRICDAAAMLGLVGVYSYYRLCLERMYHIFYILDAVCLYNLLSRKYPSNIITAPTLSTDEAFVARICQRMSEGKFDLTTWFSQQEEFLRTFCDKASSYIFLSCAVAFKTTLTPEHFSDKSKTKEVFTSSPIHAQEMIDSVAQQNQEYEDITYKCSSEKLIHLREALEDVIQPSNELEELLQEIKKEEDKLWDVDYKDCQEFQSAMSHALSRELDVMTKSARVAFLEESPSSMQEAMRILCTPQSEISHEEFQTLTRIIHTIKGSAQMSAVEVVAIMAHKVEDLLTLATSSEWSVKKLYENQPLLEATNDLLAMIFDCIVTIPLEPSDNIPLDYESYWHTLVNFLQLCKKDYKDFHNLGEENSFLSQTHSCQEPTAFSHSTSAYDFPSSASNVADSDSSFKKPLSTTDFLEAKKDLIDEVILSRSKTTLTNNNNADSDNLIGGNNNDNVITHSSLPLSEISSLSSTPAKSQLSEILDNNLQKNTPTIAPIKPVQSLEIEKSKTKKAQEVKFNTSVERAEQSVFLLSSAVSSKITALEGLCSDDKRMLYGAKALSKKLKSNLAKLSLLEASQDIGSIAHRRYSEMRAVINEMQRDLEHMGDINQEMEESTKAKNEHLSKASRIQKEISYLSLKFNMVSITSVSDRLEQIIQTAAKSVGVSVGLDIQDADVVLDRQTLNKILPIMQHVLRNSVDHGFSGSKSTNNKITISCKSMGANIEILVSDNGSGLNYERILEKAREKNLLSAHAQKLFSDLTDKENGQTNSAKNYSFTIDQKQILSSIVFSHGFSTKEKASTISGRGVGMDVVASTIAQIGGQVSFNPHFTQGSQLVLRFPATTAIAKVLIFKNHGLFWAMPASSVKSVYSKKELLSTTSAAPKEATNDIAKIEAGGRIGTLKSGKKVALLDFNNFVGLDVQEQKNTKQKFILELIVDKNTAQQNTSTQGIALEVQDIEGIEDVVIQTPTFSSASQQKSLGVCRFGVLGNDELAVVLNIFALLQDLKSNSSSPSPALSLAQELTSDMSNEQLKPSTQPLPPSSSLGDQWILAVDDSAAIRAAMLSLLQSMGKKVVVAIDGQEAIELLHKSATPPHLIFTDLEMPRCDGFELVQFLKSNDKYKSIPCFMISSRSGQKYSALAKKAGVNDFISKPFDAKMIEQIVSNANQNKN